MKQKISVSVEEELIKQIEEKLKEGLFRSKSHVIEYAVNKLLNNSSEGEDD